MAHDESPTARALLALELIQSAPGITAERLGERLRVTDRAARRYVGILREAGLPVESVRGPYGGYRLGRGSRTPLMFSTAEALGLVMAVLDGHHDVSDSDSPVGAAIGKITRALPEPVAHTVQAVRRATSPAPDRSAARPDADITSALVQSCVDRRQLRIDYRLRPDRTRTMIVDPWAVVVRHARWYLLCWSHTADARRVLRIDRVASSIETGETFHPADVDPVAAVEENLAEGWEYRTEVIFDGPQELILRCIPRSLGRIEAIDAGGTRLVGSTSDPQWYAEELAASPVDFKIIGGDELRDAAVVLGRRLLAAGS
ncbi:WYL domain-containing protein [Microlunatus elymi]|uniref:WYL domain-containing protein n=1 Tax=Microlunatus elymi TaxID=2596828 RepID=A0A516Q2X3_9ACTN|nr:WYL domain-containing protein [Microlunatus elymi]QDP97561.1 WYL domain-containing protein [Microlunatus elymi]